MTIAAQVKQARSRLKWSRARLAREAGVSLSTVKRVEGGELPSGPVTEALCNALGSPLVFTPTPPTQEKP